MDHPVTGSHHFRPLHPVLPGNCGVCVCVCVCARAKTIARLATIACSSHRQSGRGTTHTPPPPLRAYLGAERTERTWARAPL